MQAAVAWQPSCRTAALLFVQFLAVSTCSNQVVPGLSLDARPTGDLQLTDVERGGGLSVAVAERA